MYIKKKYKQNFMNNRFNNIDFFLIDNMYFKLELHNISGLFCKQYWVEKIKCEYRFIQWGIVA